MALHLTVKLCVLFLIGLMVASKVDSERTRRRVDCSFCGDIIQQHTNNNQQMNPSSSNCACYYPLSRGYMRMPGLGYVRPAKAPKNWLEANAECAAEGATLPVPRTVVMAEALAGAMDFRLPGATSHDWAWLGANDFEEEGKWITPEGLLVKDVSTMHWYPGEPNYKREENCMVFNRATAKMGDAPCVWKAAFVCFIPFE